MSPSRCGRVSLRRTGSGERPRPLRIGASVAGLVVVFTTSCTGDRAPNDATAVPCAAPADERVVLEVANVWRDPPFPAFAVQASERYFARAGFDAGPLGVGPGQTELSFTMGPSEPTVDPTTRQVANVVATVTVRRYETVALPLSPGEYRIVSSNGVRLIVLACP